MVVLIALAVPSVWRVLPSLDAPSQAGDAMMSFLISCGDRAGRGTWGVDDQRILARRLSYAARGAWWVDIGRELLFIEAAHPWRLTWRILFIHILNNIASPILVQLPISRMPCSRSGLSLLGRRRRRCRRGER
jgi:hypothetical protein